MNIKFYDRSDGTKPVNEFLNDLDDNMRGKIAFEISLLQQFGTSLRMPHSRPLGSGIYELRAQFASNITRVLYFFIDGDTAVLTHGFVKKTQKTPPSEIKRAKNYREDYLSRYKGGERHGRF